MSAEGPIPLQVATEVNVRAELPAPLEPLDQSFEFSWQSTDIPTVVSPLTEIAVNSRLAPAGGGFKPGPEQDEQHRIHVGSISPGDMQRLALASQLVAVDSTPILAFGQAMNSDFFARHPSGDRQSYRVGPFIFTPRLTSVKLYMHKGSDPWMGTNDDWTLVAESGNPNLPLPGVWLAESDPQSPTAPSFRRLQLWTDNPLIHTGRAAGVGATLWMDRSVALRGVDGVEVERKISLAEAVLEDYPDLMQPAPTPQPVCVDFDAAPNAVIERGSTWRHEGLRFHVPIRHTRFAVQQETLSQRGPAPQLTAALKQKIALVLGPLHSPFRNPANITGQTLLAWAASVPQAQRLALRQRHPEMAQLWNWLFPRQVTRTCLGADPNAALEIQFPTLVRRAQIKFCGDFGIPEFSALRAPRTLGEAGEVIESSHKKAGARPDFRACTVAVALDTPTKSGDTWTLSADEGFQCLHILGTTQDANDPKSRKGFSIQEICYLGVAEAEQAALIAKETSTNEAMRLLPHLMLQPGCYYRLEVMTEVRGAIEFDRMDLPEGWLGEALFEAYRAAAGKLGFNITQPDPVKGWEFPQAIFFQTDGPPANLRPYVKWSSPAHQDERVFRSNDIAVRFLRSGMQKMIENAPFVVSLQVRVCRWHAGYGGSGMETGEQRHAVPRRDRMGEPSSYARLADQNAAGR